MKSIHEWFSEYAQSHQHPINVWIHKIAVPLIVFSTLGLVWNIPLAQTQHPFLNWAGVLVISALLFYFRLSFPLFLGMVIFFSIDLYLLDWIDTHAPWPLWIISLSIFVVAWVFQLLGHAVEGKRPSFAKDLSFLLIGPLWVIAPFFKRI